MFLVYSSSACRVFPPSSLFWFALFGLIWAAIFHIGDLPLMSVELFVLEPRMNWLIGRSKCTERLVNFGARYRVIGHSQFSSVAQPCLTLCDPMDCSTPDFPVHHQLPELTQTHVHCIGNAIEPSHPLLSPSPPAFNLSQHQGLFQ